MVAPVSNQHFEPLVAEAVGQRLSGWDFSFLESRMIEDGL